MKLVAQENADGIWTRGFAVGHKMLILSLHQLCNSSLQQLGDLDKSMDYYKEVLKQDSTNIEAIACIGTNYFYSDQPEIALRFYRYTVLF